ncbi:glutamate receptor ionotropic, NMDA 2A-like [Ptychodera flava]|uniref:glutamate receptor ionotropic, NMDA 2A-like n=1 Tax=Ptychodera flava TaxID=63121 RepID=UPI003969D3C5
MERSTDGIGHGNRMLLFLVIAGQLVTSALGVSTQTPNVTGADRANATWKDTIRLGALITNSKHQEVILKTISRWATNSSNRSVAVNVELVTVYVNASEHIEIVSHVCDSLLPQGVTTIISAIDGEHYTDTYVANRLVSLVSRYLTAPVISANMRILSGHVYRDDPMPFLHIGASLVQQCRSMMAFLEYHNWYHFSAITTAKTPDYREFITIMESLSAEISNDASHNKTWEVCQSFPLNFDGNITAQYDSIAAQDCQIFLVYASYNEARRVFSYAKLFGLLREGFVWMLAEPALGENINIVPDEFPTGALAVKFYDRDYNKELSVQDSTDVFLRGLEDYLRANNPLPVIGNENCDDSYSSRPDRKNDTSMYHFQKFITSAKLEEKHISFDKEGFVKSPRMVLINIDGRRRWKEVGVSYKGKVMVDGVTWLGNMKLKPKNLTPHRTIRVTTIYEESFVRGIATTDGECHVGAKCLKKSDAGEYYYECCVGVCIDILTQLSKDLDFHFQLHVVEDGYFGKMDKNGRWNGMIGDILEGRADAAIASMQATKARAEVVDLSVAFMETGISVMVKKGEGQVPSDAFLAPFNYTVWLFLTLFTVNLVAIVIFMFECLSPGGYDRNIWEPRPSRFTLGSSFWIVWALLFNNTVPLKPPKGYTAKFMTNMWGCFCLIFIAMYTANLVAHLIQEKTHDKITGILDEKIQNPYSSSPSLKYATVGSTMIESYIYRTNRKMFDYMQQYNKNSSSEALKALKSGELDAFIYGAAMLRHQAAKDKDCDLRVVGETVAHSGYVIAMTKGSHWREPINQQILKYIDTGYLQTIADKWMTNVCNDKRENQRLPLGLEHSSGVFLLLLGGCLVAVVVFFVEHFFYKRLRERFRKRVKKRELVSLVAQAMADRMYKHHSLHSTCGNRNCMKLHDELEDALNRVHQLEDLLNWHSNGPLPPSATSRNTRGSLYSLEDISRNINSFRQNHVRSKRTQDAYSDDSDSMSEEVVDRETTV